MSYVYPECERLKRRIEETIRARIDRREDWARLPPEFAIDVATVAAMNAEAQRLAIDDYSWHISAAH